MATWLSALLTATLLAPAAARAAVPGYRGAEIYRSSSLTLEAVLAKTGRILDSYVEQRFGGRRNREQIAARLKAQIEAAVRPLAPLAYVDLYYSEYVSSAERTAYITLDVVDQADAAARMPFRPAPREQLADPAGVLATWGEYERQGRGLLAQGISAAERTACARYYCPFGGSTPELEELEKRLAAGAAAHKAELLAVAERSASAAQRAAALYALAFSTDAAAVVNAMQNGLQDPGNEVRAAAMNVLADIALYHKRIFLDLSRLIPALDFPSSSDRAKALALLVALADNSSYRPYVVSRAGPYLLRLLRLQQPSQHDLAYTLLSVLSQKSYDRRDYASWEQWVVSVSSATPASAPPPAR